jgi:hypothetical protein
MAGGNSLELVIRTAGVTCGRGAKTSPPSLGIQVESEAV